MSPQKRTAAVVGTTGGAGATRLTVEMGATLARAGHAVALLDTAFATQGLSRHVPGRIDADVTTLLTSEQPLDSALVDVAEIAGRLAVCPSYAPFERVARAKAPSAAERFGDLLAEARESFDYVLVDTPPVATNPAVAAVTEADAVALVAPASTRGVDATQRTLGRLADVGAEASTTIANHADDDGPIADADASIPTHAESAAEAEPAVLAPDPAFAPAVARATEAVFDVALDLEFPEQGVLDDLDDYVRNPLS